LKQPNHWVMASPNAGLRRLKLLLVQLTAFSIMSSSSSKGTTCSTGGSVCAPEDNKDGYQAYMLISERSISFDTKILRFQLPSDKTLGLLLPSCLKARLGSMQKSYSPISIPQQTGYFELLVKEYPVRSPGHPLSHGPPGGLGAHLVHLKIGETAYFKKKSTRLMHGLSYSPNRWSKLGFLAGGTGIAPFFQIIQTVLRDPTDHTHMSLVFANRHESDILLRDKLDQLARDYPQQFRVRYVLSKPPLPQDTSTGLSNAWHGGRGRVGIEDVQAGLPIPGPSTMIMVCGRDEFLTAMSGMTTRGPPPTGKKKGSKLQGDLVGLLKLAGFSSEQVYKF